VGESGVKRDLKGLGLISRVKWGLVNNMLKGLLFGWANGCVNRLGLVSDGVRGWVDIFGERLAEMGNVGTSNYLSSESKYAKRMFQPVVASESCQRPCLDTYK
jgi:hypothetical protein